MYVESNRGTDNFMETSSAVCNYITVGERERERERETETETERERDRETDRQAERPLRTSLNGQR
jgi:hypothetical protein